MIGLSYRKSLSNVDDRISILFFDGSKIESIIGRSINAFKLLWAFFFYPDIRST